MGRGDAPSTWQGAADAVVATFREAAVGAWGGEVVCVEAEVGVAERVLTRAASVANHEEASHYDVEGRLARVRVAVSPVAQVVIALRLVSSLGSARGYVRVEAEVERGDRTWWQRLIVPANRGFDDVPGAQDRTARVFAAVAGALGGAWVGAGARLEVLEA